MKSSSSLGQHAPGRTASRMGQVAGGLALCGFEVCPAAGVIVEMDFILRAEGQGHPEYGHVDLDGDGMNDLAVVIGTASVVDAGGHDGIANIFGLGGGCLAFSSRGYPMMFQAGDVIGSTHAFRSAIGTLAFSSAGKLGGRGHWFGGGDGYLGFEFNGPEGVRYGWVHAVWNADDRSLTIDQAGSAGVGEAVTVPFVPSFPEEFRVGFGEGTDVDSGRVEVRWPVLGGYQYVLQRSTDLEHWVEIHQIVAESDGHATFVDVEGDPESGSEVFYRVGQLQLPSLMLLALGRRRFQGATRWPS